jgi:hypothetical protein
MKKSLANALEIEQAGGVIAASAWTTGSGNYVHKRAIPEFCREIEVADLYKVYPVIDWSKPYGERKIGERPALDIPKAHKARIKLFLKAHPKTRKVIYIADRRGFNAAKKGAGL